MAVFLELVTDAFQETFSRRKGQSERSRRAGASSARRPLRGLEIKDDTHAVIRLITASGTEIPLFDSGSPNGRNTNYTNFIIQSVSEARMEKHQIVDTFGESYIFFFGESPRFLDVQAVVVDSHDFNWYAEFWENYERYLRGTKSVELNARTYLFYDDIIVEGYMLQAQAQKTSELPLMAQLSFRLYLTNYSNVSFVEDEASFPVRGSINLPEGVTDVNQLNQDPAAYAATVGANLQQLGFGGGNTLTQALRSGADPSKLPAGLQPILRNADLAYGIANNTFRQRPLRELIAENVDEFTGAPPIAVEFDFPQASNTPNPGSEVQDLPTQSMTAFQQMGMAPATPALMNNLGLGPNFSPVGVGLGFGAPTQPSYGPSPGMQASYGVSGGIDFRGVMTSVGGGSVATSSFGAGAPGRAGSFPPGVSLYAPPPAQYTNNKASSTTLVQQLNRQTLGGSYQNGVLVGGVSSGAGFGGGIPQRMPPPVGFRPVPSFVTPTEGAGAGAGVVVRGSPSAFSMVVAQGTLTPSGFSSSSASYSLGGL